MIARPYHPGDSIGDWMLDPPPDDPLSICSVCGAFDDGNQCDDCEFGRQVEDDLELLVEQWPPPQPNAEGRREG